MDSARRERVDSCPEALRFTRRESIFTIVAYFRIPVKNYLRNLLLHIFPFIGLAAPRVHFLDSVKPAFLLAFLKLFSLIFVVSRGKMVILFGTRR